MGAGAPAAAAGPELLLSCSKAQHQMSELMFAASTARTFFLHVFTIFWGLVPGFVSLVHGNVRWVLRIVFWVFGIVFWVSGIVFLVSGIIFWVSGIVFWVSGIVWNCLLGVWNCVLLCLSNLRNLGFHVIRGGCISSRPIMEFSESECA